MDGWVDRGMGGWIVGDDASEGGRVDAWVLGGRGRTLPPHNARHPAPLLLTPHRLVPSPSRQTRDVVDAQGWMHTGDVGLWLPGGRLKIIDRWGVGLEGGL